MVFPTFVNGHDLAGRYRILEQLGVGATAEVYLAEDLSLHRQVIVKVLLPSLAAHEGVRRAFRDRIVRAATLSHPHLARVFDGGQESGAIFMITEYLDGGSLEDILATGRVLGVDDVARLGRDVASALSYVHANGFVHADLSPDKLLFDDEGRVRVSDIALAGLGDATGDGAVAEHFVAVSTNAKGVAEFGIDTDNMLEFWDWVGGRYSYDSAIGFSLMIAIGRQAFTEMLAGFHAIDEHFKTAPLAENLPVIQGMLNVWYNNLFGAQTHAVLPYSHRLARFPAYLQQLTMESNGKSVKLDGTPVEGQTGEIFWGEPGTNGQHAFYQLIHQGTKLIPADFIAFAESTHDTGGQQDLLMANCLAQTKALAFGKTAEEIAAEGTPAAVVPHKVMPGNRPSSTILAPKLTPSVLGQLVALYEHTVFVEGTIWDIDSFDQWGVELGKVMAKELAPILTDTEAPDLTGQDSSTASLVRQYRGLRGRAV